MAEKLERFPEDRPGEGPVAYPWDEWANGEAWKLSLGEDYSKRGLLLAAARAVARRRGLELRHRRWYIQTGSGSHDGGVIIQFVPKNLDEGSARDGG